MNHVIRQVQVSQDLSLKKELCYLTSTRVGNLVMREIKLGDGLIQHESLDENRDEIIINQVTRQSQEYERLSRSQTLTEYLSITHLHAE